ncbi:NADPH2:quinone reductase [Streptosporangium subroseum]|uniref:NADPH2:quinone reductase n=1 Tax=Streptosporangium subroseum TaxID=106412 RepID=A0A239D6F3_9ACTN|nr:zinc-binding dehydrogenase [Streptosporangium subroseum]SNS27153.1 NADPH2:quinone reductase [Streptosporangium subroseum]
MRSDGDGGCRGVQDLAELAETGKLTVRVGATYPLEHVADAQRALSAGGTSGKVVIEIT